MALPEHLKRYLIEKLLKTTCKLPSQRKLSPKILRHAMTLATKCFPVHQGVVITSTQLADYPAERHTLLAGQSDGQVILHIHGGVFFLGGSDSHRALASQLCAQTGATVYVLDYPLAPEYPCPAAINAVKEAYMALIVAGHDAKNIVISGDSCGGNLALAALLALRDEKVILPSAMLLMSPFLDLTLSGESIRLNEELDAMLSRELLEQGSRYYVAGQYPLDYPMVSPLFANLAGLPPTLVQVGSKEMLLDDANRFKALADAADNQVELVIYPGMWHVFQMFSPWIDMAAQSLIEIKDFLQKHTPRT